MSNRPTGTVKWFNNLRGFGFIIPDEGGSEIFVHYSQVVAEGYRTLNEGDRVFYDLKDNGKGPAAHNVTVQSAW